MDGRWVSRTSGLLLLSGLMVCIAGAQSKAPTGKAEAVRTQANTGGVGESVLQRRYEAAQTFQAAHEMDKAAQQYRIFIADGLGEIARARAAAGQYEKAANDFDEALRLVPDFPMLQVEYARAALDSGNLEHARLLARGVIEQHPENAKATANAHAILGRVLLKMDKDAEAKEQIEAAVALDPTFENGYELAIADLDLGDQKGAAKLFEEMQASFGDTALIHMYFGQAYGSSDFQAQAVEEFQKAIAKDDRLPGVHYSLAASYLATAGDSKLPQAEAELRKEIALSPGDGVAYSALGHLLAGQPPTPAREAEAESDLRRAIDLDPSDPDGFLYLGQFYADQKKPAEAETALRRSIALTKDVSRNRYQVQKAHYLLGRLLMQTGQVDEGKKEIAVSQTLAQQNLRRDQNQLQDYLQEDRNSQAAEGSPAMPVAVNNRPPNAEAARHADAIEKQLGPALADSYNNLGATAGSESDYRGALLDFREAAEWNPSLPGLDFNWGRAAFAAGAPDEAVGPLSRYLRAHPEDEGARKVLGLSEFMGARYAAARATLQPLANMPGEPPQVQYAYAQSMVKSGDLDAGVQRLLALERSDPNVGEVHRALGEAYAAQGKTEAASELTAAVRLNPQDAKAQAALGTLQLSKGDARSAVAHLEAAAKLEPGNAELQGALAEARRKAGHR